MELLYVAPNLRPEPSILSLRSEGGDYHICILHAGITVLKNNRDQSGPYGEHRHGVFHIVLFLDGGNYFLFDGRVCPVARGTLVICSPGTPHSFAPSRPGENTYAEITFEYLTADERLEKSFHRVLGLLMRRPVILPDGLYSLDESGIGRFLDLFHNFFSLLRDTTVPVFDRHLKLAEILRFCSRLEAEQPEISSAEYIQRRIDGSLPGRMSLSLLAREFNTSKAVIIREFSAAFGQTPMAYYRRTRLAMAAALMMTSDRTMEDIAQLFCFSDVFHFMKAFRQEYGITPGAYRKKHH